MPQHRSQLRVLVLSSLFALVPTVCRGDLTYITDFTKNNNIYTDLNEQFPNTGPGVPGSGVGVANTTYLYNPATYTSANFVSGSDLAASNPTTFLLASNSTGQDFTQLTGGSSLTASVNVTGVTTVYALMSAYFGTTFSVTFTGANGATETFSNVFLPDFNGGVGSGGMNNAYEVNGSSTDNLFSQTALIVHDVGAGGTGNSTNGAYNDYDLTQVTFVLSSQLAATELESVSFTSNGDTTLLLGLTVQTAVPEPSSLLMAGIGIALPIAMAVYRQRTLRRIQQ